MAHRRADTQRGAVQSEIDAHTRHEPDEAAEPEGYVME
jgi:hypothetical protein